jgi:hypothetical protein
MRVFLIKENILFATFYLFTYIKNDFPYNFLFHMILQLFIVSVTLSFSVITSWTSTVLKSLVLVSLLILFLMFYIYYHLCVAITFLSFSTRLSTYIYNADITFHTVKAIYLQIWTVPTMYCLLWALWYHIALYGYTDVKALSVSVWTKYRLFLSIFEPKADKIIGQQRKLHSKEFRSFECLSNVIRKMKLGGIRWRTIPSARD